MSVLTISGSPHIHTDQSVQKIMMGVIYALIPAFLVSIYFFGLDALVLTVVSVASCMLFEYLIQKYLLKGDITCLDHHHRCFCVDRDRKNGFRRHWEEYL